MALPLKVRVPDPAIFPALLRLILPLLASIMAVKNSPMPEYVTPVDELLISLASPPILKLFAVERVIPFKSSIALLPFIPIFPVPKAVLLPAIRDVSLLPKVPPEWVLLPASVSFDWYIEPISTLPFPLMFPEKV